MGLQRTLCLMRNPESAINGCFDTCDQTVSGEMLSFVNNGFPWGLRQ